MNKAFAVNGFVRRYRWTLLRRATELLVLICFTGTARWGWEVLANRWLSETSLRRESWASFRLMIH